MSNLESQRKSQPGPATVVTNLACAGTGSIPLLFSPREANACHRQTPVAPGYQG